MRQALDPMKSDTRHTMAQAASWPGLAWAAWMAIRAAVAGKLATFI
ncbi:MAG: hypothetical protein V4488_23280 [Pseudomonadota bacterium]